MQFQWILFCLFLGWNGYRGFIHTSWVVVYLCLASYSNWTLLKPWNSIDLFSKKEIMYYNPLYKYSESCNDASLGSVWNKCIFYLSQVTRGMVFNKKMSLANTQTKLYISFHDFIVKREIFYILRYIWIGYLHHTLWIRDPSLHHALYTSSSCYVYACSRKTEFSNDLSSE